MFKKFIAVSCLVVAFSLTAVSAVSAHVVVRPAEVVTAGFQTFTVAAPNEREEPFTNIKLLIPSGLKHVSVTTKPGWAIDIDKQGDEVAAITWSGGSVDPGFRDEFTFSAQVPTEVTELQWKAYQTYANGETVAWDLSKDQQPLDADGAPDFSSSGPYSVTQVVAETAAVASLGEVEQTAADAKRVARLSFYVGIAGAALGLTGIYVALHKK